MNRARNLNTFVVLATELWRIPVFWDVTERLKCSFIHFNLLHTTAHNNTQLHTTIHKSTQLHTTHNGTQQHTTAHNNTQQHTTAHNTQLHTTHNITQNTTAHNTQQHATAHNCTQHTTKNSTQLHITAHNSTQFSLISFGTEISFRLKKCRLNNLRFSQSQHRSHSCCHVFPNCLCHKIQITVGHARSAFSTTEALHRSREFQNANNREVN